MVTVCIFQVATQGYLKEGVYTSKLNAENEQWKIKVANDITDCKYGELMIAGTLRVLFVLFITLFFVIFNLSEML